MTGEAKLKGIKEFLENILAGNTSNKFILFAHHQLVMDELDKFLGKKLNGEKIIRIDGNTDPRIRQDYVN